ncbi:hypothetical protein [Streptomyces tibetensis]|uniref:hypothetical protein n=1 Tax=Streptomyces tibetensis TaxID=2382123 RepID=UPI00340214A3
MRKLTVSLATLGLAALGLAMPATAHAGPGCNANWNSHGRDGNVRAWDGYDCQGRLLGLSPIDDVNWSDPYGHFRGVGNMASSVMNSGYVGGKDVVAFYWLVQFQDIAYGCLKPGEKYVDNLSRNRFTNGENMNNAILSHAWVTASACHPSSFIS